MKKDPEYDWYLPDNDTGLSNLIRGPIRCAERIGLTSAHGFRNVPGEHSSGVRDQAIACCHNFETAMDIGANVGMWTRPLTKHFNKTIAFEPIENHYECLLKNLRNVNPDKYDFYDKCLSNVNKTVWMESVDGKTGQSRILDELNGLLPKIWGSGKKIEMNAVTLDSFLENLHKTQNIYYESVDFLKIDVEGHESKVLEGAVKTLSRCKPIILLECFGRNRDRKNGARSEKLIMNILNQIDFWPIPDRKTMRAQVPSSVIGKDSQPLMVPSTSYFKKTIDYIFCHKSMYQETLNKYIEFWVGLLRPY